MSEQKSTFNGNDIMKYFGAAMVIVCSLMYLFNVAMKIGFGPDYTARGQFGDQFGVMNAAFSGLAFIGLMLTVAFQTKDLRTQTHALELQQEALKLQITEFQEQKEELRRSAQAQEEYNHLSRIMILVESRKMRVNVALKRAETAPFETSRDQYLKYASDMVSETAADIDQQLLAIRPREEVSFTETPKA